MNVLVDTHAMLWFVAGDERLSRSARETIESPEVTSFISMASWWEVAIKSSLGRLRLDVPLEEFIAARVSEGFRVLGIEVSHLPGLLDLPFHHRDPFDRLLICQAISERLPICTGDEAFAAYDVPRIW